jgi:hypothetical protein
MKNLYIAAIIAISLVSGCRREDIRSITVEMTGLTEGRKASIVNTLSKYNGVKIATIKWDTSNTKVSLDYDSMQIAQTNIRMAIEESGVKVKYPIKKDKRAGY